MRFFFSFLLLTLVFATSAQATEAKGTWLKNDAQSNVKASPYGLWLTENKRAAIKVEPCDEGVCGYIEWIIDGGMQYDTKNPVEHLRGQAMCGLKIIQGFKEVSHDGLFHVGAKIYKADDGDVYNAIMKMAGPDKMVVRGYMGISLLGHSQKWRRVSLDDYPTCKKPQ